MDFPQWFAAVQRLAEQAPGQRLEFRLAAGRFQADAEDVALDVEVGSVFPGGVGEVERWWHRDLPVARNEVQFGIDIGHEFAKRYGPIEDGDGGDVQGDL